MKVHETTEREIFKSITFRIIAILFGLVVAYFFTRDISLTVGITLISNLGATVAYFLHERIWDKVSWGMVKKK